MRLARKRLASERSTDRLKESYSPTYLTILSVVQAVAMGDLAQVVAASYQDFTLVQWALTFNTFGVLIITWNVFSVQSALWSWIPDVRDSAVPFVVGALELFLNHTITVSLSAWLVAVSLIAIAGALGTLHISWRARARGGTSRAAELAQRPHAPVCRLSHRRRRRSARAGMGLLRRSPERHRQER